MSRATRAAKGKSAAPVAAVKADAPIRAERVILICLVLGLVTAAVFWRVSGHDFIRYDDPLYVTDNSNVRSGLSAGNIRWAFTTTMGGNWHPLTWLSHMLDCQLYSQRPGGHHVTSLIFHVLNTGLLFLVLLKMTRREFSSAAVAALFAVHPLHVESVAWIAERKDVLSTFFWLLATGAYAFYAARAEKKYFVLTGLFLAMGLMSKAMLVTLPFVFLLLDYWPLRRREKFSRLAAEKIPFIAMALAVSYLTFQFQAKAGTVASASAVPLSIRIGNSLAAYCAYIGKTLWPRDLSVHYAYAERGVPPETAAGAFLFLVAVTIFILWKRRIYPYLVTGWFWYLGTLVPVIGLVQVGSQAMADRYTYVPAIGLFIMASWGAADLFSGSKFRKGILCAIAAVALGSLGVRSWFRVGEWKDSRNLFEKTLEISREDAVGLNVVGLSLAQEGKYEEALKYIDKALTMDPQDPEALNNKALILVRQGRPAEAMEFFEKALVKTKNPSMIHSNVGNVHFRAGNRKEAAVHYREAIRLNPGDAEAHNNLGAALEFDGHPEEAVGYYERALKLNPAYEDARKNLERARSKISSRP